MWSPLLVTVLIRQAGPVQVCPAADTPGPGAGAAAGRAAGPAAHLPAATVLTLTLLPDQHRGVWIIEYKIARPSTVQSGLCI